MLCSVTSTGVTAEEYALDCCTSTVSSSRNRNSRPLLSLDNSALISVAARSTAAVLGSHCTACVLHWLRSAAAKE